MALFKVVDGVRVECTPEEEAQIRAEWAANDALPRLDPVDSWATSRDYTVLAIREVCKATGVDFEQVKAALKGQDAAVRTRN